MRARRLWQRFWEWYERNYRLNVAFASILFLLQLNHLLWMAADPAASRIGGHA